MSHNLRFSAIHERAWPLAVFSANYSLLPSSILSPSIVFTLIKPHRRFFAVTPPPATGKLKRFSVRSPRCRNDVLQERGKTKRSCSLAIAHIPCDRIAFRRVRAKLWTSFHDVIYFSHRPLIARNFSK